MSFSMTDYLQSEYGIQVKIGQKFNCPHCGHKTMSIKRGDRLAKCFHPSCGQALSQKTVISPETWQSWLLSQLTTAAHKALFSPESEHAWPWLKKRGIDPDYLKRCLNVGLVPEHNTLPELSSKLASRLSKMAPDEKTHNAMLNELKTLKAELMERFDSQKGWLVFTYTSDGQTPASYKFRKPDDSKAVVSWRRQGLFNPTGEALAAANGKNAALLLAEGEFNILRLHSLQHKTGQALIPAMALGGCQVDTEALAAYRGGRLMLWQDNDEAGEHLAASLQQHRSFALVKSDSPGEDLRDWLDRQPKGSELARFQQFIRSQPEWRYRPAKAIKNDILTIRDNPEKRKQTRVNEAVTQSLLTELVEQGTFYNTAEGIYYFHGPGKKLYAFNLGPESPFYFFLCSFGINLGERGFAPVIKTELLRYAIDHGKRAELQQYCYFCKKNECLYLYNGSEQVFKITADEIQEVENGTDGILFKDLEYFEPFSRVKISAERMAHGNIMGQALTGPINFDPNQFGQPKHVRRLMEFYLYSLFFGEILPTRPILTMIGEKGSSKSTSLKRLGCLLKGNQFKIHAMVRKPEEFDLLATRQHLTVLDNVDDFVDWLNEKLAVFATGGAFTMRRLYTNEMVDLPIKGFLAITTRTLPFNREDICERLLPIELQPLFTYREEGRIIDEVLAQRDEFMSYMLYRLQWVVRALAATKDFEYPTRLRMADFARFCLRLGRYNELQGGDYGLKSIESILEQLIQQQQRRMLEGDELAELLVRLAEYGERNFIKTWTATQMHSKFVAFSAESPNLSYSKRWTPRSLGKALNRKMKEYNTIVSIKIKNNNGNHKVYEVLSHKNETA